MSSSYRILLPILILALAAPLSAQGRRRAVRSAGEEIVVNGRVTDADTGSPVIAAEISAGGHTATTGTDGRYQIQLVAGSTFPFEVKRTGYESAARSVAVQAGTAVDFQLKSKPTIQVRTTSGETRAFDAGTGEWAYIVPFGGAVRGTESRFCKEDGTQLTVKMEDVVRIAGPATPATNSCCTSAPMTGITVTLRSGDTSRLFFQDSCFGFSMDFLGRDHATAQFVYLKFTEIAEIVFP